MRCSWRIWFDADECDDGDRGVHNEGEMGGREEEEMSRGSPTKVSLTGWTVTFDQLPLPRQLEKYNMSISRSERCCIDVE